MRSLSAALCYGRVSGCSEAPSIHIPSTTPENFFGRRRMASACVVASVCSHGTFTLVTATATRWTTSCLRALAGATV